MGKGEWLLLVLLLVHRRLRRTCTNLLVTLLLRGTSAPAAPTAWGALGTWWTSPLTSPILMGISHSPNNNLCDRTSFFPCLYLLTHFTVVCCTISQILLKNNILSYIRHKLKLLPNEAIVINLYCVHSYFSVLLCPSQPSLLPPRKLGGPRKVM